MEKKSERKEFRFEVPQQKKIEFSVRFLMSKKVRFGGSVRFECPHTTYIWVNLIEQCQYTKKQRSNRFFQPNHIL